METLTSIRAEQNISVVQKGFADFLSGNINGILDASAEDVTWGSYENPVVPYAGSFFGKKGVADFFSTLGSAVDYKAFEPKDFYTDKDVVFVKGYHEAVVKSTGKTFGHDFLMEFTIRDGLISRFFAFVDSKDQADAFTK